MRWHPTLRNALPFVWSFSSFACVGLALEAAASGKPESPYPERYEVPADTAAQQRQCADLTEEVAESESALAGTGPWSRLDFVRTSHRASERYLEEHCGGGTADGLALSAAEVDARAAASSQ